MSLIVEDKVHVVAEPEEVWALLSEVGKWSTWWKEVHHAALLSNRLDEDAELEVVIQPRVMKTTLKPVVDMMTPNRTLSLTHVSPVRQLTVTFTLVPEADRTRIEIRGVFQGLYFFLMRIAQQGDTPRLVLHGALRGLRKAVRQLV